VLTLPKLMLESRILDFSDVEIVELPALLSLLTESAPPKAFI